MKGRGDTRATDTPEGRPRTASPCVFRAAGPTVDPTTNASAAVAREHGGARRRACRLRVRSFSRRRDSGRCRRLGRWQTRRAGRHLPWSVLFVVSSAVQPRVEPHAAWRGSGIAHSGAAAGRFRMSTDGLGIRFARRKHRVRSRPAAGFPRGDPCPRAVPMWAGFDLARSSTSTAGGPRCHRGCRRAGAGRRLPPRRNCGRHRERQAPPAMSRLPSCHATRVRGFQAGIGPAWTAAAACRG